MFECERNNTATSKNGNLREPVPGFMTAAHAATRAAMSRRQLLRLGAACLGTAAMAGLTACGNGSSSAKNGELNIFIWSEYIPDDVVKKFEDNNGVKVNLSTFNTPEDMVAKVKSGEEGTYDLIMPSDYIVKQMIDEGLIQKMDHDKLKGLDNFGSQYMKQSYDPDNSYVFPYMGADCAIAVNTGQVKSKVEHYTDLLDPDFKGKVVTLDEYRKVIGMAAISIGMTMNETDDDKLAKIKEQTLKFKPSFGVYDSASSKSSLISGDCTLGYTYGAEIALAMEEVPDIQIVYPSEGCYVGLDNWALTKGAKNEENAYKFLNYVMEPETAAAISQAFPYVQTNTKAIDLLDDDFKNNKAKNVPAEVFENGFTLEPLSAEVLKKYQDIWTALKQ